jgi:malonate transporter
VETLLTISLPFFGLIGAGYLAARARVLPDEATAGLNIFVFRFALPVMLFMKMAGASLTEDFDYRFILAYSGGGLLSFAACVLLGRLLFRPGLGESGLQGMGAAFGNVGYMGLPIIIAVFGERVIVPAVMVIVFDHLLLLPLTTAMIQMGRGGGTTALHLGRAVLFALARNPLIIATAAGLAWGPLHLALPAPVETFGNLMANAAAPCALFGLGATLAGRSLSSGLGELTLVSACKLVLHPALAFGIATLVGLDPLLRAVAVVEASLPVAANVFIMARAYNVYVERTSSAILVSTVCGVVTVSAVLALVAS